MFWFLRHLNRRQWNARRGQGSDNGIRKNMHFREILYEVMTCEYIYLRLFAGYVGMFVAVARVALMVLYIHNNMFVRLQSARSWLPIDYCVLSCSFHLCAIYNT